MSVLRKLLDDEEAMGLLLYPVGGIMAAVEGVLAGIFGPFLDPCGIGFVLS